MRCLLSILLFIMRRYFFVYRATGTYHVFMLTDCWQDRDSSKPARKI